MKIQSFPVVGFHPNLKTVWFVGDSSIPILFQRTTTTLTPGSWLRREQRRLPKVEANSIEKTHKESLHRFTKDLESHRRSSLIQILRLKDLVYVIYSEDQTSSFNVHEIVEKKESLCGESEENLPFPFGYWLKYC